LKEKKKQREPTKAGEEDEGKEERVITLRPLNRQDFKEAKNQVKTHCGLYILLHVCLHCGGYGNSVCVLKRFKLKTQVAASFAAEGAGMGELKQWNELYGEGGSRKKEQLTYFL